ncbi:hypothetical protein OG948_41425 (plasmid) [Embleya sp. NBC_00888]|uniref:hypothetical protein n=1 Tax=Embleya sp. NBC_00888 TaxID=2975960 RepID=UPI003865CFAC|nr:hypothetical protein OG948_41425 [Embleya sp. NBC_00888]
MGATTGSRESESAGIDALARANMVAFAAELVERGCAAEGLVDPDAAEEDDEGRAEYRLFAVRAHENIEHWIAMPGVELAVVRAAEPDGPWSIECDTDSYAWADLVKELADEADGLLAIARNVTLLRAELARRGLALRDEEVNVDVDACGGGYEAFTLRTPAGVVRLGVPDREAGPGSRMELFVNGYGYVYEQAIEAILDAATQAPSA